MGTEDEDISTDPSHNKLEDDAIFKSTEVSSAKVPPKYKSYKMKVFGRTIDYVENVETLNTSVGSIAVRNSADVSLGDKTFFNEPVIIKGMIIDNRKEKIDTSEDMKENSKQLNGRRILRSVRKHRFLICTILLVLAVVVAIFVAVAHFFDMFGQRMKQPIICEERPSSPSHYICGYASACTRCKSLFPNKDICHAYYEPNCADLRCFCQNECTSLDCMS